MTSLPSPLRSVPGCPRARGRGERGFSLLEVAIVAVLIGIILAIALPTWQSQTRRSQDQGAQTRLDVSYNLGQEAAAFNSGKFPEMLAAAMSDPQASFTTGPSTGFEEISVDRVDELTAVYAALSHSERCWVLVDRLGQGPSYGEHEGTCHAGQVNETTINGTSWKSLG